MGSSPVTGTPPASTQFPGSNTSSSTASNQLNGNSFITLLTAQLKAQSPLNPMDPTQMVDQLAQINSLQQLIQIQGDMQTLISAVAPGTQTNGTSTNGTGSGTGTGTGA